MKQFKIKTHCKCKACNGIGIVVFSYPSNTKCNVCGGLGKWAFESDGSFGWMMDYRWRFKDAVYG